MAQIEFEKGTGTFPYFIVLLYGIFLLVITSFGLRARKEMTEGVSASVGHVVRKEIKWRRDGL
uniref:Uncharacterized protein n=1 Tax=Amphimedon queenslandica TaxID=400682 RepID=A0A1X7TUS2_AMPQE